MLRRHHKATVLYEQQYQQMIEKQKIVTSLEEKSLQLKRTVKYSLQLCTAIDELEESKYKCDDMKRFLSRCR